nr:MAG TPA_asm: hypothetical protein [Caudoviricetes sp.]
MHKNHTRKPKKSPICITKTTKNIIQTIKKSHYNNTIKSHFSSNPFITPIHSLSFSPYQ